MFKRIWLNGEQIGFIFLVFLVFVLHVTGFVKLQPDTSVPLIVNRELFANLFAQGGLPPLIDSLDFRVFLAIGLTLTLLLPIVPPIFASVLALFGAIVPLYLSYRVSDYGALVPLEYLLAMILVLFVMYALVKYISENRAKQRLINIFGQYVPPEIVRELSQNPDRVSLEGEARELTVFFCDIKDFTRISHKLTPKELTQMLNTFFTEMSKILHKNGATIDKYVGDSIVAFWGAPLPQTDHAILAVKTGLEMQQEIAPLQREFRLRGWPELDVGIGINTGNMNVGNMGSEFKISYTVLGDAVNLGERLERLTREYQVPIIVSEKTRDDCHDVVFKELDIVQVRGREVATRIYQPVGLKKLIGDTARCLLTTHHAALYAYYNQDWETARSGFQELHRASNFTEYYDLFLKRIEIMEKHPPKKDWEGITNHNRQVA